MRDFILFQVADQRFVMDLSWVKEVVPIPEISEVAEPSDAIIGCVDFHGKVIHVISMRRLQHFAQREVQLSDLLLILERDNTKIALLIDQVKGVVKISEDQLAEASQTKTQKTLVIDNEITTIIDPSSLFKIPVGAL